MFTHILRIIYQGFMQSVAESINICKGVNTDHLGALPNDRKGE